ncbi:succinyl-CoA synthetase, beta subunit [Xenococcus sp. PCC 7305]|uniref:ATP-grasp domain-containing protein n=1 Tax=Xenococcus sp. PCC 7305 TaxID=102125 RepID=UPI0002ABFE12|nr:ATP-grasp domain-containing protein [Xenococcus sp. PCC 7305]ELS04474.1 succinyl-CoA synthetase, beta subunit [Xenococcus sp. PCC 7305]
MDLLEYQAKKLFRQVGIPILPSQTIKDPRQIKQLQIPYPVVLKSQVRAGGRGKAGGVKFVENTIDAIAAARNIFNLAILGEYPDVILAEARYDAHRELFLAIALDYQLKRPVLLGSSSGGMDVKLLLSNLQQVVIETEFSLFYARRLASRMNLSGNLLLSVSKIIEKMYSLFQSKDLALVEINPLGVNSQGQLMALDGKMTINDNALSRHPEIVTLSKSVTVEPNKQLRSPATSPSGRANNDDKNTSKIQCLDWQNPQGKIAILTNDVELAILGWDLISQAKKKPAFGIVFDYALQNDNEETQIFCGELKGILNQLQSFENIDTVLINFWLPEYSNKAIAKTIFDYYHSINHSEMPISLEDGTAKKDQNKDVISTAPELPLVKFVVRLLDEDIRYYQEEFKATGIYWTDNLEEVISKV